MQQQQAKYAELACEYGGVDYCNVKQTDNGYEVWVPSHVLLEEALEWFAGQGGKGVANNADRPTDLQYEEEEDEYGETYYRVW